MAQSKEYPDLPFVAPRAFGRGRDGRRVQYLVIHHTAGSERSTSAEDGAAYDARRTDGVSTHYFVDSNSVVQCVYTVDRANAAHFFGNRCGIQYELCGTLQTRAQWLDAASDATLTNAARQAARDCRKYNIPARKLSPAEVASGVKGICGHWDVTLAHGLGNHTDPGPNFPWDVFLARVRQFIDGGDDMSWTEVLDHPEHKNIQAQHWLQGANIAAWKALNAATATLEKAEALLQRPTAPPVTLTPEDRAAIVSDVLGGLRKAVREELAARFADAGQVDGP